MKKFISVFLCIVVLTGNVIFIPYVSVLASSDPIVDVVDNISFTGLARLIKSIYSVGYSCRVDKDGDSPNSLLPKKLDAIWGEDSAINKWLQTKLFPFMDANRNIDLTKPDCPITYDKEKQLVNFNPTFTKELGEQVQSQVHALDGYYLCEPTYDKSFSVYQSVLKKNSPDIYNTFKNLSSTDYNKLKDIFDSSAPFVYTGASAIYCFPSDTDVYLYINTDGPHVYYYQNGSFDNTYRMSCYIFGRGYVESSGGMFFNNSFFTQGKFSLSESYTIFGAPFKVFYSRHDLEKYLNNGKQRTYAPQLPSTTISIPIKYINNTTNLPDLSFNLDSLIGKAEADIQAGLDAQLKIYLDKLAEVNINPDKPVTPTPTPDGGFTDGTTPTPKPDFGDGSDLTDTNDWLKKIYEWLQSFGDTHSKFEKTITDYIEANNGKLDQIIEAINALSDGKTEDEKNGCKYDFTALSDFMTKLWNESDKKFDKMVELLEENNKYQKKLVNSLNEIKAILVTQTIMDVFQDRSQQTAEKAKDKFPTSLPWDIALVVNAMSAEPEKPQFNLPIQIKSLNINEEIHVDLASGEWEKLAKTCRYLLSILFILLMIQLSRKLFSNGGDD